MFNIKNARKVNFEPKERKKREYGRSAYTQAHTDAQSPSNDYYMERYTFDSPSPIPHNDSALTNNTKTNASPTYTQHPINSKYAFLLHNPQTYTHNSPNNATLNNTNLNMNLNGGNEKCNKSVYSISEYHKKTKNNPNFHYLKNNHQNTHINHIKAFNNMKYITPKNQPSYCVGFPSTSKAKSNSNSKTNLIAKIGRENSGNSNLFSHKSSIEPYKSRSKSMKTVNYNLKINTNNNYSRIDDHQNNRLNW